MPKPITTDSDNIKHWVLPEIKGRLVGSDKDEPLRPQTVEDIEAVYEEGRQKGYEDGYKEGVGQAKSEINKITAMFQFLQHPLHEMDEQVEEQLTELALTIARLLLKKECCEDVNHIQQLVHDSLEFLPVKSRNIQVHLNPEDIQLMQQAGLDPFNQDWKCVEDSVISRGGCKIDSDQSHIDASVETRVQLLVDQLNEHLPQYDEGDEGAE